ncbi:hypothetical protein [Rhizobium sp. SL86]|uniref:hypothetical protein n=1 Tax=Rhizobium sp. SL86 TaxID=2995148 RepID=UPI00227467D4|nr:hypothetical protein [Rhizobium sp. SL86]MCY1669028.1 hypothetical protein [Rhizobium sp. SL86]
MYDYVSSRRRRLSRIALGMLLSSLAAVPAVAAEITTRRISCFQHIHIEGEIGRGDDLRIEQLLRENPQNVVSFNGVGGDAILAARIGAAISEHRAWTFVLSEATCQRGCALAWLGGVKRYMGRDAVIRFGQANPPAPGEEDLSFAASTTGYALTGAYLARLGFKETTIARIVREPLNSPPALKRPEKDDRLTFDEAEQLGIDVLEVESYTADTCRKASPDDPDPTGDIAQQMKGRRCKG